MIYEFENQNTGERVDRSFSMDEVPEEFEEDGVLFRRYWGCSAIVVPWKWTSTDNRPKFGQSPSGKKHFY